VTEADGAARTLVMLVRLVIFGAILVCLPYFVRRVWREAEGPGYFKGLVMWLKENPLQMIWTLAAVVLLALMASAGRC